MTALDLFCGAGGASAGLNMAGFDVTGIDIKPQPNYPFRFIQADVMRLPVRLAGFDFIWASPPCQAYIRKGCSIKDGRHERLIEPTRVMLVACGRPWVIENVEGAPVRPDLILCGTMFGLPIRRHRWFEGSPPLAPWVPFTCDHGKRIVGVYGRPHGQRGAAPKHQKPMLPGTKEMWSLAMGIDWMSTAELAEAIPPAYSEFIGRSLLSEAVEAQKAPRVNSSKRRLMAGTLPAYHA